MCEQTLYYDSGEATYAYQITGQGIPIVLLHGFTGTKKTWASFVSAFKSNFKVITIDLPGHGKTVTRSGRTIEECCTDLARLFDYLQLTQLHLIGYSMGGRTALSFALSYPDSILTLTLESASPGLVSPNERMERIKADEKLARVIEVMGMKSFVNYWENIPLFKAQKKLSDTKQQMIREERLAQSDKGLAESLRMMGTGSQLSYWDELSHFTRPVLLITGEHDKKFIKINENMQNRFINAQHEIIRNSGHAVHIEQPEVFLQIVNHFILSD